MPFSSQRGVIRSAMFSLKGAIAVFNSMCVRACVRVCVIFTPIFSYSDHFGGFKILNFNMVWVSEKKIFCGV